MLNCVMALRALGYPDDHPAVANGVQAIEDFLIEHDGQLFFQPCVSPTWDTALTCKALLDSGMPGDASRAGARRRVADREPDLRARRLERPQPAARAGRLGVRVRQRLVSRHRRHRGDPDGAAADRACRTRVAYRRALAHGTNWTLGMQSRNGGWGAFDTDNTAAFLNRIPFADMEAMIDPPTEDLTGRLLELMGNLGFDLGYGRARRAHAFLLRTQRADGSWWGRWGEQLRLRHLVGPRRPARHRRDPGRAARAPRGRVAARPSERRRRLGRDARVVRRRDARRPRRVARRRRRRGRCSGCSPAPATSATPSCAASIISSPRSAPTAAGTRTSSPAPDSRATSTCATGCTANYFPLMALGQCRARLEEGR